MGERNILFLTTYREDLPVPLYRAYVSVLGRCYIDQWVQRLDAGQDTSCIVDLDEIDACALVLKGAELIKVVHLVLLSHNSSMFDSSMFDGIAYTTEAAYALHSQN